jgi:hypothetical protein
MAKTLNSNVKTVPISTLKEHPKNPRVHTQRQIEELCRSVKKFGQIKPIVVNDNMQILAGHGVKRALEKTGATTALVNIVTGLSKKDQLKLLLADNHIFTLGIDDYQMMESIIREINDYDIPGFDKKAMESLMQSVSDVEINFAKHALKPVDPAKHDSKEHIVVCPNCHTKIIYDPEKTV